MQKPSLIFGVAMFIVTAIVTYLNSTKFNAVSFNLIINVFVTSIILSATSTVAYFFGVKKSTVNPPVSKTLMAVLFAYFVGNSFAMLFGLREISWFLFALVVVILSYLAPVRFFKPKEATVE